MTATFRMSGAAFAASMTRLYAMKWIWGAIAVVAACGLAAALSDVRWLIVALMVVFIVAPMVFAFLYFNHGLRLSCACNVLPHSLAFSERGITATVETACDDAGDGAEAPAADAGNGKTREFFFPAGSFRRYHVAGDGVVLPLAAPEGGFLWIPAGAFSSRSDFNEAVGMIGRCLRQHTICNETP